MTESEIVEAHVPCPNCGSSDAMCVYSDGHTYCFACETQGKAEGNYERAPAKKHSADIIDPLDLNCETLPKRGISQDTCRKYDYYKGYRNNKPVQIACYRNDKGEIVGQKIRYADKSFEITGSLHDRFFGQHLWSGGKKLIITEGEIDCMSVSQIQQNKYPAVSIPNGAQSAKKVFKANYDWLESFEEVIVMFDMDEAGRKAVDSVCGLLSPNKLKIATLPFKDANECLQQGNIKAIFDAIWNAKTYKPAFIINGADMLDTLLTEEDEAEGYSLPWDIPLAKMTLGLRKGELVLITAGTGTGKSTFVRQLAHHLGVTLGLKVGTMMLEENSKRTAKGLMAIHAGKRLALNKHLVSDDEFKQIFEETLGTGRFIFYEHFGSLESDDLIKSIRYMATAEKCDFIVLDHISIAISGLDIENERKATDVLMTRLRSLCEETGVGMLIISHLKRIDGQPAEEGGMISLSHLRGSQALSQLSDAVWALERNQQADDDSKNVVRLRILKGRFTGETGIAGYLLYEKETDRLVATTSTQKTEIVDLGNEDDNPF